MRLFAAAVSGSLLALLQPAGAAPLADNTKSKDKPVYTIGSPPIPKIILIPEAKLSEIAAPFMPTFQNGTASVDSFKPKDVPLIRDPKRPKPIATVIRARDDRLLDSTQRLGYPYSAVGKVILRQPSAANKIVRDCSGAAIGARLMLTANHCFPHNHSLGDITMEFIPAYDATSDDPEPYGSAYATECTAVAERPVDGTDYIVCRLNGDIGPTTGWLGWTAWDDDESYRKGKWSSVGYPARVNGGNVPCYESPVVLKNITNSGFEGKLMTSSPPYVSAGWSGGPLFGWSGDTPYIAGVVTATAGSTTDQGLRFELISTHAGGKRLAELIEAARHNATGGS